MYSMGMEERVVSYKYKKIIKNPAVLVSIGIFCSSFLSLLGPLLREVVLLAWPVLIVALFIFGIEILDFFRTSLPSQDARQYWKTAMQNWETDEQLADRWEAEREAKAAPRVEEFREFLQKPLVGNRPIQKVSPPELPTVEVKRE